MDKDTAYDLIVDSHGKCFFCLHSKLSPTSLDHSSNGKYTYYPEFHSLHYLYRYVGMNIRKMLNLEMTNSSQLNFNQKVPRQLAKVYLCDECSEEYALFGKLFQQLEKTQMELMSSLETIHRKLASGDKAKEHSQTAHMLGLTNDLNDKLELVHTARERTKEKCYSKLKRELPRISVKKLSAKVPSLRRESDESDSAGATAVKVECIKVENPDEQDQMSDEGGDRDWLDDGTNSTSEDEDVQQFKLPSVTEHVNNVMKTEGNGTIEVAGGYSYVKIKPTRLAETLLKPMKNQSIVDPKTEQHTCRICSMTFNHSRRFQYHYRVKHLNEIYKCTYHQCGKIFTAKSSFYLHHQQMHMGIKFYCKICKKSFGRNQHLVRHHRMTSCGKGLAPTPAKHSCHCRICGKGFGSYTNLRRHHITAHLQLNRFECNFCGMKFKRSDVLKVHVRNIHQKRKIKEEFMYS